MEKHMRRNIISSSVGAHNDGSGNDCEFIIYKPKDDGDITITIFEEDDIDDNWSSFSVDSEELIETLVRAEILMRKADGSLVQIKPGSVPKADEPKKPARPAVVKKGDKK